MKTRIIQTLPSEPAESTKTVAETGADAPRSTNLAARMGRWSASHWKTATFGWLAFVVASFAIGIAVPMKMIEKKDAGVGEAGKANKIIDEAFDLDADGQGELVVIQSKTKTVDDPAFRATIIRRSASLSGFKQVERLRSPLAAGNEGQISPDRHAVLITFSPRGTYDEAALYIDDIVAATAGVQKAHPDFYVAEAGVSTEKALDKVINGGIAKAGLDRPRADARDPAARARLGRRGTRAGPGRADRRVRRDGPRLAAQPARADGHVGQRGDPPDRARRRRRLLTLLPPPRARRATGRAKPRAASRPLQRPPAVRC